MPNDASKLERLMASLPAGTFDRSQIIVAETVIAPSQVNAATHDPMELLQFLPRGLPRDLMPRGAGGEAEWAVLDSASSDLIPLSLARAVFQDLIAIYRRLRGWCCDSPSHPHLLDAFDSLSRLGFVLLDLDPDAVVDLFDDVEATLKFAGDFTMMMRFGKMVEQACDRTSRRTRRVVEYRTQATTCAVAWVQQRVGLLEEADRQLQLDERLNRDVDEQRGLAFTLKCRGRLRRIMAERSDYASSEEARGRYISDSVRDLNDARETFQHLSDGDRIAQVCDTDALLARTALSSGALDESKRRLSSAELLRPAALGKTIWDCLILTDELAAAEFKDGRHSSTPTTGHIQEVIEATEGPGYERNEIRARALIAKANVEQLTGRSPVEQLKEAREIYRRLGDRNAAAQVTLALMEVTGEVNAVPRQLLAAYPPDVRVRAVETYRASYGEPTFVGVGMRRVRGEDDLRWIQAIAAARSAAAQEVEIYR